MSMTALVDKLQRTTGVVKFYQEEKGFGFCTRDGDTDVFIHAKDLRKGGIVGALQPGEALEFETVAVPGKAPKAVNIKRATS